MAQNMYRVGDYVYFEVHHGAPYQIRKIEELNKTQTGNVEAKVVCYYRRRDVSAELLRIADQAERRSHDSEEEGDSKKEVLEAEKDAALPSSKQSRVSASQPRESRAGSASQPSERRAASAASDHTGSVGGSNGNVVKEEAAKEKKENGASDTEKAESSKAEVKEENGLREWGDGGLPLGSQQLDVLKRHVLRQRELFGSRVVETLPATHIRGKCFVTLLSEVETPESYDKEDCFFYSLMYDPTQMTLLADKGCIKVGEKYQAYVPATMEESRGEGLKGSSEESKENGTEVDDLMIAEEEESAPGTAAEAVEGEQKQREIAVYHPHHSLTDRDIDQFLIIARAVGTFSRALDTSSSTKLPSLHMTAAAASRDVTLFHAMALLHQAKYDIGQATKYLVPPPSKAHYPLDADRSTGHNTISLGGPILCRDQMEEWSAAEANLFEEAIEKYGKDFNDVKNDFLPWKCIRDVVEYYYMWKTTNRYSETKKNKHPDQDSKLKQVYIPNYNKPNPNLVCGIPTANAPPVKSGVLCEGCQVSESIAWYAWGPHALHLRLCQDCWTNWKKMGGLRRISQYEYFDLGDCVVNVKPPITQAHNAFAINKHAPPSRLGAASTTRGVTQQVIARLPPTHSQAHGQAVSAKQIQCGFSQQSHKKDTPPLKWNRSFEEYKFNCFDKTFGFVRDEAFNMVLTGNELQIPHYDQRSQKDT